MFDTEGPGETSAGAFCENPCPAARRPARARLRSGGTEPRLADVRGNRARPAVAARRLDAHEPSKSSSVAFAPRPLRVGRRLGEPARAHLGGVRSARFKYRDAL